MEENFNTNQDPTSYAHERKGLAMASVIVGITSIPLGYCTGFFGIAAGLAAILMGIFSKGGAVQRSGKAIAGIITGAIGLILGLIMFILAVRMMNDPEAMAEYNELIKGYMEYIQKGSN